MDINKLEKAKELLNKKEATKNVIEALKNLQESIDTYKTEDMKKLLSGAYVIKTDLYLSLQELHNRYSREFDEL